MWRRGTGIRLCLERLEHLVLFYVLRRSPLRIHEVTRGQAPQSEQEADLQNFATLLSDEVERLLGHQVKEEFLSTFSNVAPLFLRSHIASQDAEGSHKAAWRQQAALAVRHAGTLSGSLAILTDQEPADLQSQDCLTSGSYMSHWSLSFAGIFCLGFLKACVVQI